MSTNMDQPDMDTTVFARINGLVNEEHKLFERGELSDQETRRLAAVQVELDQCWDLLRQRRALREFGGDPSQAHVRDADVVKKYIG
jgi:5,10-methylenetetrahydrofolate reductase